jgi:hypothetical protein
MRLQFRVIGTVVEWLNPRIFVWEPATNFITEAAAQGAHLFYNSQTYEGWASSKLSKSSAT